MSSKEQQKLKGHCLCGECRFELIGNHNWVGHCYCESCRRATASPMTTWIGQENGFWKFTGREPARYQSSAGTTRGFCPTCGSPMFFQSDRFPNEVHFFAALLADPEVLKPTSHCFAEEKLSWLHLSNDPTST